MFQFGASTGRRHTTARRPHDRMQVPRLVDPRHVCENSLAVAAQRHAQPTEVNPDNRLDKDAASAGIRPVGFLQP